MASDDEIRPMIEHEEPVDVKVEEGTSSNQNINDAVVKTSSSAASAAEDDLEVSIELTGCGASAFCDPRRMPHRFIALFLMCLLGFGSTFCYDNPGNIFSEN